MREDDIYAKEIFKSHMKGWTEGIQHTFLFSGVFHGPKIVEFLCIKLKGPLLIKKSIIHNGVVRYIIRSFSDGPADTWHCIEYRWRDILIKGAELKLVRGGRIPPCANFPLLGYFLPTSGHTFSFFSLYIVRMAKSSRGGGNFPPWEAQSGELLPSPPPLYV